MAFYVLSNNLKLFQMKKLYSVFLFLFLFNFSYAQLTGITPNQGTPGQTLSTTITSNGLFMTGSSPSGNIQSLYLQGSSTAYFDYQSTIVLDPNTATSTVTIPIAMAPGLYSLNFQDLNFNSYSLPNAFTVLPPDGYAQGKVYRDVNNNGIFDAGDVVVQYQYLTILPGNFAVQTNVNGDFSYPLANGNYTITYSSNYSHIYNVNNGPNPRSFTINNGNTTGLDFGLQDILYGLTPGSGYPGQTVSLIVNSIDSIFIAGAQSYGNITNLNINNSWINITTSSVTIMSPTQVHIVYTIPTNSPLNTSQLIIRLSNGNYYYQATAFTVIPPPSYLTGHFFFDANDDGILDVNEPFIANERAFASPDSIYAYSNSSGLYWIPAVLGTHTVSYTSPNLNYVLSSGSVSSYTFTNSGNVNNLDFGLRSSRPDYSINISSVNGLPRCNTDVTSTFTLYNQSNVTAQGTFYVVLSNNITYVNGSPAPSAISGDTIFWTFNNLIPFTSQLFSVTYHLPASGTLSISSTAIAEDGTGTPLVYNDGTTYITAIRCSFDPNDKAATPVGEDEIMHYTLINDTLEYLIRFQNTGTDTAFTVFIRDTISTSLDINSLEIINSSHQVEVTVDRNRTALFQFNNILLPDSNIDEPGSNGFVKYRIRPMTGIPDPTVIHNRAFIFFDLNPPVETNETWNTMVTNIPVGITESIKVTDGLMIYPNPVSDYSVVSFKNEKAEKMLFELISTDGRIIFSRSTTTDRFLYHRENIASGIYFVRLTNTLSGAVKSGRIVLR